MDKLKMKNGASALNIIIMAGVICVFILFGTAIGAAAMGMIKQAEPNAGGKTSGQGCYLKDEAFTDSNIAKDQIISALEADYPQIKDRGTEIETIIRVSGAQGINPAILVSFWGAEQSFNNPDQAFGCGNTGDGSAGATGFDAESSCAAGLIKNAIEGTKTDAADWTTPTGGNIWTRLLFHYVMGNRTQPEGNTNYEKNGYVSDSTSPRIKFLNMLIPDSVACNTGFASNNKFKDYNQVRMLFGSSPEEINRYLVDATFLGKNIRVNKTMIEDLKNAEREIKQTASDYQVSSIGGYNFRYNVNDSSTLSDHAFGLAIDINPEANPNMDRPAGSAERDPSACTHDIPDAFASAMERNNFFWGAKYASICDAMHFQYGGNWQ